MNKKTENFLKEGQPVVYCKKGDRTGALGVIKTVDVSAFRVEWLLSPEGVPYPEAKSARYAHTALAPKELDVLSAIPETGRGFAFIYPIELSCDITKMVEAHRITAEAEQKAVQVDFYMIGGVHSNIRYDINARNCPEAPPLKKYLDEEEAISDASEMAAKHNQTYVVMGVTAVVKPKSLEEVKPEVTIARRSDNLLEQKQ